ncbi:MAG: NTP transferase domain-containing protein, partial [Eubacteriales bacterium]|nr:NTP transferase domain-containing protein [Eubacteriales bacterium]
MHNNHPSNALDILILAAGKGTRMHSSMPKVLHCLGGKPLLKHVIDTAATLSTQPINVVIGHGAHHVRETLKNENVQWIEQTEQLGTGHAVRTALPYLSKIGHTLILYGDVPLIDEETLRNLVQAASSDGAALLTDV